MDIEKLIERLRKHRIIYKTNYDEFSGGACTADCVDAADIISTLQAENEKLRAELEQVKQERDERWTVRPIDADWIKSNLNKVFRHECDQLYGMMQLIDEAPTLIQKE